MSAALQSILGDRVKLPDDLVPDDTELAFWGDGCEALEIDYDDPADDIANDIKNRELYSTLALAFYNRIHGTEYKVVVVPGGKWCSHDEYGKTCNTFHRGFAAAQTTDAESAKTKFKNFFAVLKEVTEPMYELDVYSCCIVDDDLETIGCEMCDINMCRPVDPSWTNKVDSAKSEVSDEYSTESIESKYGHCLDDDVNLSRKARLRMDFPLIALAHFNKKKKKDYKLVDALPNSCSIEKEFVIHCNFIARQISPADDVSKKLFFAELKRTDIINGEAIWKVTSCLIIHGCEIRAGCLLCTERNGKRIVHPTRGFCFGLYPHRYPLYRHAAYRHPAPFLSQAFQNFKDQYKNYDFSAKKVPVCSRSPEPRKPLHFRSTGPDSSDSW